MKKILAVFLSMLLILCAFPIGIFAETMPQQQDASVAAEEPNVAGTWKVTSPVPKTQSDFFSLLNGIVVDVVNTEGRNIHADPYMWETFGPKYAEILIFEKNSAGDSKSYIVKMEYVQPDQKLIDEANDVAKQLEKEKAFIMEDMNTIWYYNTYGSKYNFVGNHASSHLTSRTLQIQNLNKSKDIEVRFYPLGFSSNWLHSHLKKLATGLPAVTHIEGPVTILNKGVPCANINMMYFYRRNVIYVPENSKDCLRDARERVANYLGHNNFKLELGGTQKSLNREDWLFNFSKDLDESKLADDKYYILTLNGTTYLFFLYRMPAADLEMPQMSNKDTTRIAGSNRFETALLTADALKKANNVSKFDTIVVADGLGYADALSGTYLAAAKKAPILTVGKDKISQKKVREYIAKNLSKDGKVYILGGKNAVTSGFESSLGLPNSRLERLGGADRYSTNLMILKEAGINAKDVLICSGTGFADSLSASATGRPILLVGKALTADQKAYLGTLAKKNYYIIGGTKAVSADVEKQVKAYGSKLRLTGANRFETSALVAKTFFGYNAKEAVFAYAMNFPDGLSGGPLAYTLNAPLLLVTSNQTNDAEKYIKATDINSITVLGGTKLISDEAVGRF